jgi:hypothetical protein
MRRQQKQQSRSGNEQTTRISSPAALYDFHGVALLQRRCKMLYVRPSDTLDAFKLR